MLNNNNFSLNSKKYYQNLKKAEKIFKILRFDLKNFKIPLLESYEKNYHYDF